MCIDVANKSRRRKSEPRQEARHLAVEGRILSCPGMVWLPILQHLKPLSRLAHHITTKTRPIAGPYSTPSIRIHYSGIENVEITGQAHDLQRRVSSMRHAIDCLALPAGQ